MADKYTSIHSNFRGFNFQRDYDDPARFEAECLKEAEGRSETNWAVLLRVEDGRQIAEYRRGAGVTYNGDQPEPPE